MIVAIAGASGFIGGALAAQLRADGHVVRSIGRRAGSDIRWDPERGSPDARGLAGELQGAHAVVNLAGSPMAQRWTAARKRALRESRVRPTALLAAACAIVRPTVLVSASALGIYGDRGDEWLDESSTLGQDFTAGIAREWEGATAAAEDAGVRVVHARTGIVLHPSGGALRKMLPAFRLGVGGPLGRGTQWMSWISLTDELRALRFAIGSPTLRGAVNLAAPEPVTSAEFAGALGAALRRPALIPVPAFALRVLFGEVADVTLLASQRLRPAALLAAGFTFAHPALATALRAELG